MTLDVARLETWVSAQVGAPATVRDLVPIASVGNARRPYEFTVSWPGGEVRAVLLLKAAAGQLETEVEPEFRTIAALDGCGVPIARALWLDATGEALGRPGFATEWTAGTADTRLLRRDDVADIREAALELAAAAARLHAVDPARFPHLPPVPAERAALAQLDGWEATFHRQRLEPHPVLRFVARWLRDRPPRARRVALVHGDLRFGNLLQDGGHVTALLDWEMTHLGDPVEDLGWVYRDLWTPVRSLPFDAFLAAYADAGGDLPDPQHLRWWQVFGEFKHAVISLTATRSFADHPETALRHANRAATVPAFGRRALELIGEAPC